MSPFEFVSVAVALGYAMALGTLVSGLSPSLRAEARYPIHIAWIAALILAGTLQWWILWVLHSMTWTPIRFLFVLSMPGILLVRAGVLLGDNPAGTTSFRDHFFDRRISFFSLHLVVVIQALLSPWVYGSHAWFTFAPVHRMAVIGFPIAIAGLLLKSERAHAVIVVVFLMSLVAGFVLMEGLEAAAG